MTKRMERLTAMKIMKELKIVEIKDLEIIVIADPEAEVRKTKVGVDLDIRRKVVQNTDPIETQDFILITFDLEIGDQSMKEGATQGLDQEKEATKIIEEDEVDQEVATETDQAQEDIQDLGVAPEVGVEEQGMTFMPEALGLILIKLSF